MTLSPLKWGECQIEYKALERGIPVVYVETKNTSITCS